MQIYAAYHRRRYQRAKGPYLFIGAVILLFLISTILIIREVTKPGPVTPYALGFEAPTPKPIPSKKPKDINELEKKINNELDDSIPEYSIIVDDFLSPFHIEMGTQESFIGASIHKIYILAALYQKIEKGEISPTKEITFQEEERQDYGTGQMRYEPAGGKYTVKELMDLMMRKSDNTAAYILGNEILTQDEIQVLVTGWGLYGTNMKQNVTTNTDANQYFRKLFTGKILSSATTREAIDLFTDSDFEDRLPALLPNETKVYHKIGTTIAGLHDVGVVASANSFYYIGIFTKGVSDEERATRAMARVSRAVFQFMNEN